MPGPQAHADIGSLIGRREALGGFAGAFLLVALAREARAFAAPGAGRAAGWIDAQQQIAADLAGGRISGRRWADEIERLAAEIEPAELLALLERARITPAPAGGHNDPVKRYVRFLDEAGQPRRLAYGTALFDFAPANVITPHGHRHMVSAHMIVSGALRVRNFDRVGDEGEAMLLRPTRDYVAKAGDISTMCSERDNVHWFVPVAGKATTFDVVVSGLDEGAPDHVIEAVDPLRARRRGDGLLAAPLIGFEEAALRYTAEV